MRVCEIISEFRQKMVAVTGVNEPVVSISLNREAQGRLDWELLEISRYSETNDLSTVTLFEGIQISPKKEVK